MTVLEYIKEEAEFVERTDGQKLSAKLFLEEFGFTGKIQHSPLSSLSGGERKRLFLVRLLIGNPNFLILDEPTNDFDIFTMNVLEQFLMQYQGCLLIVSHDRYFMDKTADSLFILEEDGSVSGFVGKCSEYIEYREEKRKEEAEEQKKKKALEQSQFSEKASSRDADGSSKRKMSFKEQKEFESIEEEIAKLEERKSVLEAQMASGEKLDFEALNKEYAKVSEELEVKYWRWEELASLA